MNFLKQFKTKECKNLLCRFLQLIIFHNVSRLLFFSTFLIVGAIGVGNSQLKVWEYIFAIGLIYLTAWILISIIFAFIIKKVHKKGIMYPK